MHRAGYARGLGELVRQNGIAVPEDLEGKLGTHDFATGFVNGVGLWTLYPPEEFQGKRYTSNPVKSLSVSLDQRQGYRLGFVVGIARDHGVVISPEVVPDSYTDVLAFMQGTRAEPRSDISQIPPAREMYEIEIGNEKLKSSIKEILANKNSNPFFDKILEGEGICFSSLRDDYVRGLGIWLQSHGISDDVVIPSAIANAQTLQGFKDGLEKDGRRIPATLNVNDLLKHLASLESNDEKYQRNPKPSKYRSSENRYETGRVLGILARSHWKERKI